MILGRSYVYTSLDLLLLLTITRAAFVPLSREIHLSGSDSRFSYFQRRNVRPYLFAKNDGSDEESAVVEKENNLSSCASRRDVLSSSMMAISYSMLPLESAEAALAKFPCETYQNTYHIMRAGESLLEEEGMYSTNPLFLTSSDSTLSEKGKKQLDEAVNLIKESNQQVTLIKFSLAAHSIGSCTYIGDQLKLGGDRRLQEFTYMDPRAVGKWDGLPTQEVEPAIWAMDVTEAGPNGTGGQPPATDDSTPNETLAIQVTRLRQLISVLDTSFSGDSIIIIFPDGTGPALLTCMIGGIPLNRVHELNYEPGEIHFNVTQSRALAMLSSQPQEAYLEKIEKGKEQLKFLRENEDSIKNVNEQRYEEEQQILIAEQEAIDKAKEEVRTKALAEQKEKRMKARATRSQITDESSNNNQHIFGSSAAVVGGIGALLAGSLFGSSESSESSAPDGVIEDQLQKNELGDKISEPVSGRTVNNGLNSLFDNDDTVLIKSSSSIKKLKLAETSNERNSNDSVTEDRIMPKDPLVAQPIQKLKSETPMDNSHTGNKLYDRTPEQSEEDDKNDSDEYEDGGDAWLQMLKDVISDDIQSLSSDNLEGDYFQ